MNFEEMKQDVIKRSFIKSDSTYFIPTADPNKINAYIDLIKYGSARIAHTVITTSFHESFASLQIEQKAQLSELDEELILASLTIESLLDAGYKDHLHNKNTTLKDMATAIAIVFEDANILKDADEKTLYTYFVNARVPHENLELFSNPHFLSLTLDKLLSEERVIFTWIIQNITQMIRDSLLDPSAHKTFFSELFRTQKYIQGEHATLFFEAITASPKLFEDLAKTKLVIDPFNRQTDFSQWLQDSAKFLSLAKLREISNIRETKIVRAFDQKLRVFQEIYKHDRSIMQS
ncbi:hypothetical protein TX23_00575 [Pseudomonas paralactis]|uniref:Uncharacterized protein n=1 Tax=Pseudomonas paralactis TaxID=1615673 RepID=A0A0R3AN89_9PSED|nr:hypothetical protein [Pseudomonas paralactis]KRP74720.1 hypothetical protein TX23_00575 [Pseudomonas paralactis]